MTFDYVKVEAYACKRPNCNQVRNTISEIESHIRLAHGIPYDFIIRPTSTRKC